MAYQYYTIRVSHQDDNTFRFPITPDSLEEFASMRLSDKLNFQKELNTPIEPLSDGYIETASYYFEPGRIKDNLYFFNIDYLPYYMGLSDYEKEVFSAYIQNIKFDFGEFNENYDTYVNQNGNEEFLEKARAHEEKLAGFFHLIEFDDKLKARYYDRQTVEVNFKGEPAQLNFISKRDLYNYEHLSEDEQKKIIPIPISFLNIYTKKEVFLSLDNQKIESAEALKKRHDRILAAIKVRNPKIFWDYFEEGSVKIKNFLYDLISNDMHSGETLDYLYKNKINPFMGFLPQEAEGSKKFFYDYLYSYRADLKTSQEYLAHIQKTLSYYEQIGIDAFSQNQNITFDFKEIEIKNLSILESGFLKTYCVSDNRYSSQISALDNTKQTYLFSQAFLEAIYQNFFTQKPDIFHNFIALSFTHIVKQAIRNACSINLYSPTSINQITIAAGAHKIAAISQFLFDKKLCVPENIRDISKAIHTVFHENKDNYKKYISHTLTILKMDKKQDDNSYKESLLTEAEQKEKLEHHLSLYDQSEALLVDFISQLNTQPVMDKNLLQQEIFPHTEPDLQDNLIGKNKQKI